MERIMKLNILAILFTLCNVLVAQSPVVENVRFDQRIDGSLLVDIYYDVTDMHDGLLDITIEASDDSGATWTLPCTNLTGDVGLGIASGTDKHIVWDYYADNPDTSGYGYCVRVAAFENICGLTITKDLTLTRDLHCPSGTGAPAINIGASNITLDLGGHKISGNMSNGYIEGVIAENVDGITIKNGTFEGFGIAVVLARSNNITIENVTMKNLDIDDPTIHITGITAGGCQNLVVRDCYFEFLNTAHKEGVILGNCEAIVDNIEQHWGSVGVNYGGSIEFEPTQATVKNCRFFDSSIAGVLVQRTDSAYIVQNVFKNSSIVSDPGVRDFISGLLIEDNDIQDRFEATGIELAGAGDAVIANNRVSNCNIGISLQHSRGCAGDTVENEQCFYSTGNLIRDNIVLGNGIDLSHCDECTGNTWENNTFVSSHGSEITAGVPVTAAEGFAFVDTAAIKIAEDAQLLSASTGECDTLGKSYKWTYIYESASKQENYEFWYQNGNVINRSSTLEQIDERFLPITESWINSDSAIAITDAMGGKEFRETFELDYIAMGMEKTHSLYWTVHYVSQDTVFTADFEALME
jgi:parallel beta-helix repeat protein